MESAIQGNFATTCYGNCNPSKPYPRVWRSAGSANSERTRRLAVLLVIAKGFPILLEVNTDGEAKRRSIEFGRYGGGRVVVVRSIDDVQELGL